MPKGGGIQQKKEAITLQSARITDTAVCISRSQVAAFRLGRHHLAKRAPHESLVAVVRDICGVQAQVMAAAQVALWARVEGLTAEDIEQALWQERTLVKTWSMRGTVHLLPSQALPVHVGALKRALVGEVWRWIARHGVSTREAQSMTEAVLEVLKVGPLTRRELGERVVPILGPQARQWIEHGWGGGIKQACLEGRVCYGPNPGQETTFARRDQWLPVLGELSTEEAETALLRRYLRSYGPATPRDFSAWSGMRVRDITPIWSRLRDDLAEVNVEGKVGWILREDLDLLQEGTIDDRHVRLLPSFDSYMLGHHDKSHLVDEVHYKLVYRKAGWLSPVVLVAGRVAGVWSYEYRGKRLLLRVQPFDELSLAIRNGIEAEAADLGHFLGGACEVAFL